MLVGPEDPSFDEIGAILSDVLGKEVRYQQIPLERMRAELQGSGAAPGLIDGMIAKDDGLDNLVTRTPENSTPTSLRQWAQEALKPAILGGRG